MSSLVMNRGIIVPFLPEEIITNILTCLPVKSLIRFQCVCKHWKNLFKTPSFIADHLRRSCHHCHSLLFFNNNRLDRLHLRLIDREMQVHDLQNAPSFDFLKNTYNVATRIIGSCNGLLCVAFTSYLTPPPLFFLWNPATRDVRGVPRSKTMASYWDARTLGFGFSSLVNDYKIVAIKGMFHGAQVYLSSRDSWKEIKFGNFLKDVGIVGDSVVSSDGAIFWVGLKPEEGRVIVSFDIGMEVFTLIPWPTTLGENSESYFNLTVYKDKLAVILTGVGGSPKVDLWVMEEKIGSCRKGLNWTKKFNGGPFPWTFDFGGTIWRNEIVVFGTETQGRTWEEERKSGICRFNITTNESKMVVIPKHEPSEFLNYVESLLPVPNIHKLSRTLIN